MTWATSALLGSATWGAIAYLILRRNAMVELQRDERLPIWVIASIACACVAASIVLPSPWNAAVALAIAGYGVASWGDFQSKILWDEIVIGTTLLSGLAMALGGHAATALDGGIVCGGVMFALYFGALAFGRETGFGDVKLAFGIGVALGPMPGVAALALGSIAWLVVTLAWGAKQGIAFKELRTTALPFGPGLTIGMLLGAALVPAYAGLS